MAPDEWLASSRPDTMLKAVAAKAPGRKLRLIALEVCRRIVWNEIPDGRSRDGIVAAGLHDDGRVTDGDLVSREAAATEVFLAALNERDPTDWTLHYDPAFAAAAAARLAMSGNNSQAALDSIGWSERLAFLAAAQGQKRHAVRRFRTATCAIIREVIGPLAHPLVLMAAPMLREYGGPAAAFRARVSNTARGLAEGIVRDQAFDRLPILADALEDAGLDDRDVLDHLRNSTGHVRGCWGLDLVLGRA
jgi:hypothetical protein